RPAGGATKPARPIASPTPPATRHGTWHERIRPPALSLGRRRTSRHRDLAAPAARPRAARDPGGRTSGADRDLGLLVSRLGWRVLSARASLVAPALVLRPLLSHRGDQLHLLRHSPGAHLRAASREGAPGLRF